jgi:type II secretory pathway component GspD/PulD (secretin)
VKTNLRLAPVLLFIVPLFIILVLAPAHPSCHAQALPAVIAQQGTMIGQLGNFKKRQKAENLLRRARKVLDEGNIELAEWYVDSADRLDVDYESILSRFGDTPQSVRQAIAAKRIIMQRSGVSPKASGDPSVPSGRFEPQSARGEMALDSIDDAVAMSRPNKANAVALLQKARTAMAERNLTAAAGWYKSAVAVGATFEKREYSPQRLYKELIEAGVSVDQLQLSPTTFTHLPPPGFDELAVAVDLSQNHPTIQVPQELTDPQSLTVGDGDSISSSSLLERAAMIKSSDSTQQGAGHKSQRQRVIQLIAQAQAALDRGDVDLAEQFALRAQELRLPEAAFVNGDTRPWMVLLEISKAQRRNSSVPRDAVATDQGLFSAPGVPRNVPPIVNGVAYPLPGAGEARSTHNVAANYEMPTQANQVALAQAIQSIDPLPSPALPSPAPAVIHNSTLAAPTTSAMQQAAPPFAADQRLMPPQAAAPQLVESPYVPPAPAESVADVTPPVENGSSGAPQETSLGQQMYRQGVKALEAGRMEEAEALFREAWAYESELDEVARQSLQDHLQFVRQQISRKVTSEPATSEPLTSEPLTSEPAPLALDPAAAPKSLVPGQPEEFDRRQDTSDEIAGELNQSEDAVDKTAIGKLLSEITRKQVAVQIMRQSDPKRAWDEMNNLRDRIARATIDDEPRGQLLRRVDRQITDLENYIEQNRSKIENDERNKQVLAEIDRRREMKIHNEQQIAKLVEQFNELMDAQRFPEAIVIAKKARELDPVNPVVESMVFKSQTARQIRTQLLRDDQFQRGALASFGAVDESAIAPEDEWGMQFPRYWEDLTKRRKNMLADKQSRYTEVELQIQKSLKKQVDVQFENVQLGAVLDKLAKMANVNVYIDPEGLLAEGVTSDTPVSINLRQPVMLKSALNLILEPLHLSYVVQDEVLRVTSEQVRDGDVFTEVYNVADLVIPIPNFVPSNNIGLPGAIREAHRVLGEGYLGAAMHQQPMTVLADNPGMGTGTTNASVLAQMGASGMLPTGGGPTGFGPTAAGGGSQADFDTLIELITTTIEPDTWEEVGGPGAIDGFPGNLSLVVSQTQDVHERIIDLLEQLRRLQDLQVTIEVRFITLNDDFFERIGIDFDFDLPGGGRFNTLTEIEDAQRAGITPNVTIGLQPNGAPTVDLDIPFRQGSFDAAVPVFGGFTPDAAASIGFAILSDIEAFFLIQASQGDSRSNVLQAPKVTLFNGQTAFVSDTSQRPFVTSVIPVVGDFAAAHQPVITVLTEGTSLSVQAVVSQDRRFIRLTLVPFFSQIGDVDTFTFNGTTTSDTGTTTVDPSDDMTNVVNNQQQTIQGTTVQLPTFAFTTVNTTVSVPDGGTILLGGIKRLSEGRNERGVPMLSKLPYINRLFKNVGIGRETQSLMMMVTPRIIIQEEEEENLGFTTSP